MRLTLLASVLLAAVNVDAFAPSITGAGRAGVSVLQSAVEEATEATTISAADYNSKLEAQLAKMASKDAESKALSKEVSSAHLKNPFRYQLAWCGDVVK